jgi:glycosyltransferase involved in cell wall biosynthesis
MKTSIILSLYNCEKYLKKYLEDALNQKGINEIEFSIVHNEPTDKEKEIIDKYRNRLNIIYKEVPLEPLYASWNKAIKQSTGEYLACWNVDDLREYDSIANMVRTLDYNQDAGFTYGDIIIVNQFGNKKGKYIKTPSFTKKLGTSGAIGGPFFMWRRSLIEKVGYFDEQFKSGGDFDYTVRLSIFSKGTKTNGLLGYFLHEGLGLSTRNAHLQMLERTVIELRYGIWHKIDIHYINEAFNYKINYITENNNIRKIDNEIICLANQRNFLILFVVYGMLTNSVVKILQKLKRTIIK